MLFQRHLWLIISYSRVQWLPIQKSKLFLSFHKMPHPIGAKNSSIKITNIKIAQNVWEILGPKGPWSPRATYWSALYNKDNTNVSSEFFSV